MSANPNYPPSRTAGLIPFKSGDEWRGNPGGNINNSPKLSTAYARLMRMDDATYDAYTPKNRAERAAKKTLDLIDKSEDLAELINALKEIADRTEGKALQTKVVEHTVNEQQKGAIIAEAYYRLFNDKSEDEAIAAIRDIYRAKSAQDEGAMRQAVQVAIQQDTEAIAGYWTDAEKAVTGG